VKRALVVFVALFCNAPGAPLAQSELTRRETVRAGPATLQVTIRGKGEPIVFIPSRGRGVEDFDALRNRLAQAGYQVILPEPRGLAAALGRSKISRITIWHLMLRQSSNPLPAVRQPLLDTISVTESPGRWRRIIRAW